MMLTQPQPQAAPRLDVVHCQHGYVEAQRLYTLIELHAVNFAGGDACWLTAAEARSLAAVLVAEADEADSRRRAVA